MIVTAEQIAHIVNIANDLREYFGIEPIDDLPKGKLRDSKRCILARAFNFNCSIVPYEYGGAAYFLEDNDPEYKEHAEKFAELVGVEVRGEDGISVVNIPNEISRIAKAFDSGWLPQYIEYSN